MSIQFECPNAHTLYANESQVGRALACRTCGETAIVPSRSLGTIEVVSPPRTGNRNKGPNRTLIVILSCLVPLALAVLLSGAFLIYWLSKPTADSDLTVTDDPSTKNSLAQPATNTVNTQEVSKKLRAIGIAWFNFESQNKRFVPVGATRLSWRVHLLPYLEQGPLYEQFKLDEPWDSPHNVALVEAMPDVFRISDTTEKGKTRIQTPTGPNLFFGNETIPKFSTMTDGNQNTLLAVVVGEDKATPWTKPDELRIKPEAAIESLGKLTESFIFGISGSAEPVVLSADMSPFDFTHSARRRSG